MDKAAFTKPNKGFHLFRCLVIFAYPSTCKGDPKSSVSKHVANMSHCTCGVNMNVNMFYVHVCIVRKTVYVLNSKYQRKYDFMFAINLRVDFRRRKSLFFCPVSEHRSCGWDNCYVQLTLITSGSNTNHWNLSD